MRTEIGIIVGERKLRVVSQRRSLIVRIGKPRKDKRGDWICPFQIVGLKDDKIQGAYGIDSLQALLMAFEGIRTTLERSGMRFSWRGGKQGDTGFPRLVPTYFGVEFSNHINQLIEQEINRFSAKAQMKHLLKISKK